jgi:hypothetical protein
VLDPSRFLQRQDDLARALLPHGIHIALILRDEQRQPCDLAGKILDLDPVEILERDDAAQVFAIL